MFKQRLGNDIVTRFLNFRYLIGLSMLSYAGYYLRVARIQDQYQFSFSRLISRATGVVTSMPLPPYLRVYIYKGFGSLYGVNFDEIKVQDLNSFRTFN